MPADLIQAGDPHLPQTTLLQGELPMALILVALLIVPLLFVVVDLLLGNKPTPESVKA